MKTQSATGIEIKEEACIFYSGEDKGKPSGDINYKVNVDGKTKGEIHYSPYMEKNYSKGGYQVSSNRILGEYKSKYFKTLTGAKNFIVNGKEKYISLQEAISKIYQ